MTPGDKKNTVLQFLYDNKESNSFVNLKSLLKRGDIQMTWADIQRIVDYFDNEGYVRRPDDQREDSDWAKITLLGIECVENSNTRNQYDPADKINSGEQKILVTKLDELLERLEIVELGQQITYDDLLNEINELKTLVGVLGKKHWKQVLQGKLVDAGLGSIAGEALKAVTHTFSNGNLLN